VRGEEHAAALAPVEKSLSILGLGGSVGTPPEGVTGDVVVARSFDELAALGEAKVKGRIVLFDVPFTTYGDTVKYRGGGASAAAKLGAAAVLVRSVGPISYDTPHTGALSYRPDAPKIPAASITIEDSTWIARLGARGETVRVRLAMGAHTLPDAPSANVVGEVRGREKPDEVVLLGAHLDSWDVGQGAQDDGVGVAIVTEAARLIAKLDARPKRTVRVVLFTNEENGLRGGKAYREAHRAELGHFVAAVETDSGNGRVKGFQVDARLPEPDAAQSASGAPPTVSPERRQAQRIRIVGGLAHVARLVGPLEPLGATAVTGGHAGADIDALVGDGVLGIGVNHDTTHYWDVHHTRADTFEKIDLAALRHNVAAVTSLAFQLADE
jgi:hypothetical protein